MLQSRQGVGPPWPKMADMMFPKRLIVQLLRCSRAWP